MPDRAHVALYGLDVAKLVSYYTGVIGFEIHEVGDGFTALHSPTLELVVVRIRPEHTDGVVLTDPPRRRQETPIKVSYVVASLEAARELAPFYGAAVDGVEHEWTWGGFTRCDGLDPEGNVVQLMQSTA